MKQLKDAIEKRIKNIRISIKGTITSVLKGSGTIFARISEEEELRDIKIISHYGFYSLPLPGQNAQILFNNSSKKASFIGIENHSTPIEINPGEAIIYAQSGSYILLRDGKILMKGDLEVDGNIRHTGTISQGWLNEKY